MTDTPVSVIVVSRHRTELLLRCLAALRLQDHPLMEVIVVADPAAAQDVTKLGLPLKLAVFDEANIAAARNVGLAMAAGDVVAFIDDDAVAEPTWLRLLTAPFKDPLVGQAGGFVRGRNGISWQWRALEVDSDGQDHPLDVPDAVSLHRGTGRGAVKTQGTNCAFRRQTLLAAGGFDPAFRYFLDDADVNLRLAESGGLAAVVPLAIVQHGFAASERRRADRTPRDLHEIGASAAVFARRHAPTRVEQVVDRLRRGQRDRLIRLMIDGAIEPGDIAKLEATLETGIADGMSRALRALQPVQSQESPFCLMPGTGPRDAVLLSGWIWTRRRLREEAEHHASDGRIVSVVEFTPGLLRHRERFVSGIWWQTGGILGRSDRTSPVLADRDPRKRLAREAKRFRFVRGLSKSP
ncbi:glycosyltransferase family 2 protein [Tabrizicola sp. J26]|uniref:glycosyltransferase n=1 Tax=Alitabrizicola rongguiensis TaxID=2909234 RepID=UPI001F1A58E4|nr:glycosyltransferase [Tabrizicola rongguiensis]MCF1708294.1 glycosyltransferase family 2 protein [Tabrizicola rongguiensis]